MKIRGKLFSAALIIVIGFLGVLATVFLLQKTLSDMNDLQKQSIQIQDKWKTLNLETLRILTTKKSIHELLTLWEQSYEDFNTSFYTFADNRIMSLLTEDTRKKIDDAIQAWEWTQEEFDKLEKPLQAIVGILDEALETKVGTYRGDNQSVIDFYLEALQNGFLNRQDLVLMQNLQYYVGTIERSSASFNFLMEEISEVIEQRGEELSNQIFLLALLLSGLITLFAVIFVLLFSKRIAFRIQAIEQTMHLVAEHDFTVRTDTTKSDEIGDLGNHIDDVLNELQQFFRSVKEAAGKVSSLKDSLAAGTQQSANAIEEITATIGNMKERFIHLDERIGNISERLQKITEQNVSLNEFMEEQSSAVIQTSSSVEQISSNINSVAGIAEARKRQAEELLDVVRDGGENVASTNERIQSITKDLDNILEITEIINGVAEQTNLLSMNAAIESAHAGEAGKGFAVVAEEIRNLAERTSEQSRVISELLNGITQRINDALIASNQNYSSFSRIEEDVSHFVSALTEISYSMSELSTGSNEILNATGRLSDITNGVRSQAKKLAQDSSEIQKAVTDVDTISSEMVTSIEEINIGAKEVLTSVLSVEETSRENSNRMDQLDAYLKNFKTE